MESGGGVDLPTISTAQRFHVEFVSALNCSVTDVCCPFFALLQSMLTCCSTDRLRPFQNTGSAKHHIQPLTYKQNRLRFLIRRLLRCCIPLEPAGWIAFIPGPTLSGRRPGPHHLWLEWPRRLSIRSPSIRGRQFPEFDRKRLHRLSHCKLRFLCFRSQPAISPLLI